MKKLVLTVLIVFLLSGCSFQKKNIPKVDISFGIDNYQIYSPYKAPVSGNYLFNNNLNNYDPADVEEMLMNLSTNYFKPINSLYQAGQYLNIDRLKELLSTEYLNNSSEIKLNNKDVKPTYMTSVYEQNYLAGNGHLKGLTIGLVVNPYQAYKDIYGNYNYEEINSKIIEKEIYEKVELLVEYIRGIKGLKDVKLLVGVYLQNNPSSILSGGIKYVGITNNKDIELTKIDYDKKLLNSDYVINHDINVYNFFSNLSQQLKKVDESASVSGSGLYYNGKIQKIELTINDNIYSKSELLHINNMIAEEIGQFSAPIPIQAVIKSAVNTVSFVVRDSNSSKSNVYIIGG